MSVNKKRKSSPERFDSYEEAANFWETHGTTNYSHGNCEKPLELN